MPHWPFENETKQLTLAQYNYRLKRPNWQYFEYYFHLYFERFHFFTDVIFWRFLCHTDCCVGICAFIRTVINFIWFVMQYSKMKHSKILVTIRSPFSFENSTFYFISSEKRAHNFVTLFRLFEHYTFVRIFFLNSFVGLFSFVLGAKHNHWSWCHPSALHLLQYT